jgi:hypothetical protein
MSQMANLTVSNETLDLSAEMGPAFTVRTVIGPSFQLSMSSTSEFALTVGTKTSSLFAGGGEQGPRGLTGPEGPQGIQGIQGVQGPIGPQGIQGIKGDRGLKGDIGVTGADSIIPGPTGPQGLTGARGLTGADSTVVGPTGPQGNQGPQGLKGNTGDQGIAGVSNTPGPIGPAGPIGPMGPTGNTGAKGDLGYSMRSGTVAPTSGQFNIGDFYVNTLNLYLYGPKTVSGWGTPISIKGATGNNGEGILHGTLNPTNQGDTGDFYLRTTDYTLFGPKASGTWPAGISLIGPQGPVGPAGASSNIAGPIGPQGVQGIAGVSNVPGPTGPTGPIGSTGLTGPTGAASTVAGPTGPAGTNGTNGTNGIDGTGVVVGGTAGQLLSKIDATDFNVEWVDAPTGGAPVTGQTHRGWRVRRLTSTDPNYTGWAEIQFNDASGATTGGLVTFSTQYASSGQWSAAAAFDGTSNGWITTTGALENSWVAYTFNTPLTVTSISLTAHSTIGYTPTSWVFEYSDDQVTWITVSTHYYTFAAQERVNFVLPDIVVPDLIIDHDDTPSVYGTVGQVLAVNATADALEWVDVVAGTGGGGGDGSTVSVPFQSKWFGARKNMLSFTPSGIGSFIRATLTAAITDPYGFDGTNEFVIPAGVTKVQISGYVRPNGASDNQWTVRKNNAVIAMADGGIGNEVSEDAYTNGGESLQTGIIDVVQGDTFQLEYYVASTTPTWIGWIEVEAIEHTLDASSVPAILAGDAGKALIVNVTEDGFEWGTVGGVADPATYGVPSYTSKYGSGPRQSFITATFSGTNNGSISILFNGLIDNAYWWGSNPVLDKILLITFADPQYVTEMTLAFQTGYDFGTWRIEASNDLITWDVMNPSAAMISPSAVMTLPNAVDTTGYIYYRLVGLTGITSTGPYIHELTFKTAGVAGPEVIGSMTLGTEISASVSLDNSYFAGNRFYDVSAVATITIPSGLTGTEPVTFQQTGAADVTFAAGVSVTIQSFTSKLSIAGQFASVTLVPKGGDVYGLIGALK